MRDWTQALTVVHDQSQGLNNPFHRHSVYELYVFIAGSGTFYTDKEGIPLSSGVLLPIPPQWWHRVHTADDTLYERLYLNLPQELVAELSSETTDLAACFRPKADQQLQLMYLTPNELRYIIATVDRLIALLADKPYAYELKVNALIQELLILINDHSSADSIPQVELPPLIKETLTYIHDHLADDLSLEVIGEALFLSGGYVSRTFKKFMGLSVKEYIVNKRIERAKELLVAGASVEEAAEGSGYHNYYHFIRSFKKITSTTPGRYRIDHSDHGSFQKDSTTRRKRP